MRAAKFFGAAVLGILLALVLLYAYLAENEATEPGPSLRTTPEETTVEEPANPAPVPELVPAPVPVPDPEPVPVPNPEPPPEPLDPEEPAEHWQEVLPDTGPGVCACYSRC